MLQSHITYSSLITLLTSTDLLLENYHDMTTLRLESLLGLPNCQFASTFSHTIVAWKHVLTFFPYWGYQTAVAISRFDGIAIAAPQNNLGDFGLI